MSLFSIEMAPVPLDAETYLGEKREYTQIILETELIALTENNYIPLMQAQISLCAKIGYMYYCEYAHLLKKCMEHTCMSAIYYDQGSDVKVKQCKTIITFDTILESKILDASDLLILSNRTETETEQKPWTIACKDISRVFEIEYSTYRILNRSELCECSLTAGNYLLSYTNINCGNAPEARDGYFTTYYSLNKIVLDVITENFNIQVIMIIVCIAIALIVMYFCCTKCRHICTIFKYCFPFLPISHMVRTSRCTNLFIEVTNITKGNGIWAHFVSTRYFPSQIQLSRPIQKDDVQIETVCCIFKWIRINWLSINVTGISGTMKTMPDMAYVSIFMDKDLTHITEDHFKIKLVARLLDQMYVIQPPTFPPRYDDTPPSAPQFPEHLHSLLTHS